MGFFLGIDTSNYTTSAALYQTEGSRVFMRKKLLPVKKGAGGLRQSDAVFAHIKQLGHLTEALYRETGAAALVAVGYSAFPRRAEGSYMPCFLTGEMAAQMVSATHQIPLYRFSHQEGHVAAALYSAGCLDWLSDSTFYAFHVSGGTTELLEVTAKDAVLEMKLLAKTLDLHAGQVVDRVGVMLGFDFPCGKAMEGYALQMKEPVRTRPTLKGADCCLSGLENQCADLYRKGCSKPHIAKFCLMSIEHTVRGMTEAVMKEYGEKPIVFAGGVMSNSLIRQSLETRFLGRFAEPDYSTDNSAGIAVLASLAHEKGLRTDAGIL